MEGGEREEGRKNGRERVTGSARRSARAYRARVQKCHGAGIRDARTFGTRRARAKLPLLPAASRGKAKFLPRLVKSLKSVSEPARKLLLQLSQ